MTPTNPVQETNERLPANPRAILLLGLVLLLAIAVYWPMFLYANDKWASSDNHSHGPFVPLAALYLVWRVRKRLARLPTVESPAGLILIGLALVLHALGVRSELLRLSMLSFILFLYGLVYFMAGREWFKALLFPIGFLIFAFPFPIYIETVTFPLKLFVAKAAVGVMDQLGMSVYREGTIIHLPKVSMGVEDACSGLRSLVLVAGVSAFYAYVFFQRPLKRLAFFSLALPIAVIANLVRVLATALTGYYFGSGQILDFTHDAAGMLVLAVAGASLVIADVLLTRVGRMLKKRFPALRKDYAPL